MKLKKLNLFSSLEKIFSFFQNLDNIKENSEQEPFSVLKRMFLSEKSFGEKLVRVLTSGH